MKKLLSFFSIIFILLVGVITLSDLFLAADDIINKVSIIEKTELETIFNQIDNGTIQHYNLTDEHHLLNKNNNDNSQSFSNNSNESNSLPTVINQNKKVKTGKKQFKDKLSLDTERLFDYQINPRAP